MEYGEVCTTDAECEATVLHSVCTPDDATNICDCDGLQYYNNPSGPSCCYTSGWDVNCAGDAECLSKIIQTVHYAVRHFTLTLNRVPNCI